MEWIEITKNEDFKDGLAYFQWDQGFIREATITSRNYLDPINLEEVSPDYLPTALFFICTPDVLFPAVELLFVDVREMGIWFEGELEPALKVKTTLTSLEPESVVWRFNSSSPSTISKKLYWRRLGREDLGRSLRYQRENVFED